MIMLLFILKVSVTIRLPLFVCLFVCLFGGFLSTREFSLIWRRPHCLWELRILNYARHSWPSSREGSLACHTYCDMEHPFIMAISEDPWHSRLLPSIWLWRCHYLFLQLRCVAAGIQTPNLLLSSGHEKQGLMSWWVWHNKDPSLLKDHKLWKKA